MASVLDLDPRWRALMAQGGVIDIGFDHPSDWPHDTRGDAAFVKAGDDQLTAELCRLGTDRFVRATVMLPVRGSDEAVGIALWAQVPPDTFYAYLDTFEGGPAPETSVATLANDLPPIATPDAALTLAFGDDNTRPSAAIEGGPTDISLDDLIALYEATGTLAHGALKSGG
ncbi:DUF2199 domain-containing protein [Celeribacter marinus]|uniref:DUF2199 domain-containing protein n=1 Tax=Celeribacter marinus TaxID=1397108 RepID=UPI003F6C384C